jgi:single-strand DNA-binding protein
MGGTETRAQPEPAYDAVNHVTLRGRVSTAPEARQLPSGTAIVTLRISVLRTTSPMSKGSKQGSDWVDCVAWGASQRRRVSAWRSGDLVEVDGALRRRVYRGGAGTGMRLEVEVLAGRMVARADPRPADGA